MKRVADIVIETLVECGITTCFSVVGGGAMHLNNAFEISEDIRMIYNHHESACSMAAEAYARASGKIAAVCVTSGPGGTNAINGVQGAYVDSIPMIVISGYPRISTSKIGLDLDIRCRGVQENDIIEQVKSITKYAKRIVDPYSVKIEIQKAIDIAMEGRRGPVWLEIPLDVQGNHIDEKELMIFQPQKSKYNVSENEFEELEKFLKNSQRPCILTGSGIRASGCISEYKNFIKKVRIPIVGGSLQADIDYNEEKNYYGMSGSCGPRTGNFILQNADLILVLGNSLSFKQTGYELDKFAPNAKIIMVDADADEAKKPGLRIYKILNIELKDFFQRASKVYDVDCENVEWLQYCDNLKSKFEPFETLHMQTRLKKSDRVPALKFWEVLLGKSPDDMVFALGNSSCVVGVLQEGINKENQRVLVNYNTGSMGHDLPNAIGGAVAMNKKVVCVTGDGSFMMNIQELQTIAYNKLPIKIIVFSNNGYGAIRNTCSNFFNGVYTGCDEKSGICFPNFSKIADAFGYPFKKCQNIGQINESIDWILEQESFCMLEVDEMIQEISGFRLASILKKDGSFESPALHELTPLLTDDVMKELMLY